MDRVPLVIFYTYYIYRPSQTCSDSLKLLNNSFVMNPESSCTVLIWNFNGVDLCELVSENILHQSMEGSTAGKKRNFLFFIGSLLKIYARDLLNRSRVFWLPGNNQSFGCFIDNSTPAQALTPPARQE